MEKMIIKYKSHICVVMEMKLLSIPCDFIGHDDSYQKKK